MESFFVYIPILLCFFIDLVKKNVSYDTKNKSARNGGNGYLAEGKSEAADAGDEYGGNNEEISVVVKVDLLDHLKARNCNKSVKSYANTAHYTVGN